MVDDKNKDYFDAKLFCGVNSDVKKKINIKAAEREKQLQEIVDEALNLWLSGAN